MLTKKIGIVIALILLFIFVFNLINQIILTLRSGERLNIEIEKLHQLESQNKNLKKRLMEVNTKDFLEREARDKLGLAKEDEILIIIPDEKIESILQEQKPREESSLPNWQGWVRIFLQ